MFVLGLPMSYLIGAAVWTVGLGVAFWLLLKLRRAGREGRWKKRAANLGLSLWLLLLLLTGLEFGFAFFFDTTDSFNMSNVSKKWFRKYEEPYQKPLAFQNGQGILYRDSEEFVRPVPEERRHLCFLGDSFTYGQGINDVEDRFSNIVRRELEAAQPGKFVVTNFSNAGTDLYWSEALLEQMFADGVRVDVAVYVVCLNDIETFHPNHRTYYTGDWLSGSGTWLFDKTYFFNLLYFRMKQFQRPQVKSYFDFVKEYYEGKPWELMATKIDAMNRLCRENGCQLRIAVFPFVQSMQPEYEFQFAHDLIVEHCQEKGIPVLDLAPALQPHGDEGLVVSRFDAHPNEAANRYAAEAFQSELLSDLFAGAEEESAEEE